MYWFSFEIYSLASILARSHAGDMIWASIQDQNPRVLKVKTKREDGKLLGSGPFNDFKIRTPLCHTDLRFMLRPDNTSSFLLDTGRATVSSSWWCSWDSQEKVGEKNNTREREVEKILTWGLRIENPWVDGMKAVFFEDELRARQGSQHFFNTVCYLVLSGPGQSVMMMIKACTLWLGGAQSCSLCFPGCAQELCVLPCFPCASAMLVTRCYLDIHDPAVNCA